MIEDSGFWHNLSEKLSIAGIITGGIIGVIIFIWNWVFLKTFAKHKDIRDCYDRLIEADKAAHIRIEKTVKEVRDEVKWLKNYLLEHMR